MIAWLSLTVLAGCASARPQDFEKAITSVAFSPDHSLLAYANDKEIRVVDVTTQEQVSTLRVLLENTKDADASSFRSGVGDSMVFIDNSRIVSTGMGGLVSVWDAQSGSRLALVGSLPEGEFASTIDYSEATNRLVIGTNDGQILLTEFNGDDPGPLLSVGHLDGYIQDLQFSPDGRYFASAAIPPAAGSVEESAKDKNENASLVGDEDSALPDGGSAVSIWDADQLEKVGDLKDAGRVSKLALVPGERALLTVGEEVRVWEFLTLEQAGLIKDPSLAMQYVGVGTLVTVSGLALVAGAVLGAPFFLPDPSLAPVVLAPFGPMVRMDACIRMAAISPDGQAIVTTTNGPSHNVMAVIDRNRDKVVEKWTADLFVCDMEFSSDGKRLLTATSSGVFIYNTLTWKKERLGSDK